MQHVLKQKSDIFSNWIFKIILREDLGHIFLTDSKCLVSLIFYHKKDHFLLELLSNTGTKNNFAKLSHNEGYSLITFRCGKWTYNNKPVPFWNIFVFVSWCDPWTSSLIHLKSWMSIKASTGIFESVKIKKNTTKILGTFHQQMTPSLIKYCL